MCLIAIFYSCADAINYGCNAPCLELRQSWSHPEWIAATDWYHLLRVTKF
jgi:hypothetical protein